MLKTAILAFARVVEVKIKSVKGALKPISVDPSNISPVPTTATVSLNISVPLAVSTVIVAADVGVAVASGTYSIANRSPPAKSLIVASRFGASAIIRVERVMSPDALASLVHARFISNAICPLFQCYFFTSVISTVHAAHADAANSKENKITIKNFFMIVLLYLNIF